MLWLKSESLEGFLKFSLLFLVLLICTLYCLLAWKFQVPWHWIMVSLVPIFLLCLLFVTFIKQRVLRTFTRTCLYAEAIAKGEFSQFTKSPFSQGKVSELYEHLWLLSQNLEANTSTNEPRELFQLLQLLSAPVIILNNAAAVVYANKALYHFINASGDELDTDVLSKLGLIQTPEGWELSSKDTSLTVLSSAIENQHQLFAFIDISPSLREVETNTRHQLIERIYELGLNTLSPSASIAEHLKEAYPQENNLIQSCEAISHSCEQFGNTLARYMQFSKNSAVNPQWVLVTEFLKPHLDNYADLKVEVDEALTQFWCDSGLLQRVIADLIQNAYEAGADHVSISFTKHDQYAVLEVTDDGDASTLPQAIQPFYSTKGDAEGLSLYFAKSIIENHLGVFECQKNTEGGATIMMILPFPS